MTDAELLARARVFHAGSLPVEDGRVIDEGKPCELGAMTVEHRGTTGWAICCGGTCLDRTTGRRIVEPQPSSRTDDFIARTRFPDIRQAFAFLDAWKASERADAMKARQENTP